MFDYTWNHALSHFYNNEKLIETTERAQDNALDKIFNSLIFDEHYFSEDINIYSLETKLASIYENILKEEFKRISDTNGFSAMVGSFVKEKWIRKFNKFGMDYEYD